MAGWYDEIVLLFGPVGHTHNGIDANHKIHNEVVGRSASPTLADWVSQYEQSWIDPDKRPTAGVIVIIIYLLVCTVSCTEILHLKTLD